ncbi:MAG: hypothetical protein GY855_09230, partial [candidate division Zixibacteria bacterium]|nr:hypothetical protein [candidate division Zixibacteria bacterium]
MNKLLILMLLVIFLFPVLVQSESYSDNNQSLAENTDSFVKNTRYIANANPCRGDILASDTCSSGSLFEQLPLDCDGSWAVVTSDTDLEYFVYDDYEAFGSISNIQWWGIDLHYGAKSWEECDEDPATFNIHFCPDNGSGAPDEANPVSVYTITVVHAPPAVCVLAGVYSVWEWYTELDPVCNLQQGWVGIQGVGNGDTCVFMWYNSRENVFGYNSWQNNGYT